MADEMPRADEVQNLTPEQVARGVTEGSMLLVDVREPNETSVETYPDAVIVPLSAFDPADIPDPQGKQVVFACRSGQPLSDGLARRPGRGLPLQIPPRRRHHRLEGGWASDQHGLSHAQVRAFGFARIGAAQNAHADDDAMWALLKTPGHVVLLRHSNAPGATPEPYGIDLKNCAIQRSLDDDGRAQARVSAMHSASTASRAYACCPASSAERWRPPD